MKMKKIIAMLLALCMIMALCAGCGSSSTAETTPAATEAPAATAAPAATEAPAATPEPTEEPAPTTMDITDMTGNVITVPYPVTSVAITSGKGSYETLALLDRLDVVTGYFNATGKDFIYYLHPETADITNYGSFDDANVEGLLELDPDIIFSAQVASNANEQMQSLGMPVYIDGVTTIDDPYEGFHEMLKTIASMVGEDEKADAILEWEEYWLDFVAERVKDIPDSERKTVYFVRNDVTQTFNEQNILGLAASLAGGIDVAADAFSEKFYGDVDAEQIIDWDPDIIFCYIVGNSGTDLESWYNDVLNTDVYGNVTAVKNGDCYIAPMGLTNWGGKIETSLGVLLLAKIMYPDLFEDVCIRDVANEYYSTFMNVTLDDDAWAVIAHNMVGANELPLD